MFFLDSFNRNLTLTFPGFDIGQLNALIQNVPHPPQPTHDPALGQIIDAHTRQVAVDLEGCNRLAATIGTAAGQRLALLLHNGVDICGSAAGRNNGHHMVEVIANISLTTHTSVSKTETNQVQTNSEEFNFGFCEFSVGFSSKSTEVNQTRNITCIKSTQHVIKMKRSCLFCGYETAVDENRTDHVQILDQQQIQRLFMNQ